MTGDYVIGVDQGTSSTKALLIDCEGRVVAEADRPIAVAHPQPGWVEQDPAAMVRVTKWETAPVAQTQPATYTSCAPRAAFVSSFSEEAERGASGTSSSIKKKRKTGGFGNDTTGEDPFA